MVQTMSNIFSQIVNWVFEFEKVSYGAGDSVVKRRFHTCVSLTLNSVSMWSGRDPFWTEQLRARLLGIEQELRTSFSTVIYIRDIAISS